LRVLFFLRDPTSRLCEFRTTLGSDFLRRRFEDFPPPV
jgi:hypothetical protein